MRTPEAGEGHSDDPREAESFAKRLRGRARARRDGRARSPRQSGMMWEFTVAGVRGARRGAPDGRANPSQIFRVHAANSPDKPALIWRDESLTFGELDERIDRARRGASAARLRAQHERRPHDAEPPRVPRGPGGDRRGSGRRGGQRLVALDGGELVYLASTAGRRPSCFEADLWPVVEQAKKSLPDRSKRLHRRRRATSPGCARFEDDCSTRAARRSSSPTGRRRTTRRSSSTPRARPASPRAPCASSRRTRCPRRCSFIGETPMRVDDVHLVDLPALPLDRVRLPHVHRICSAAPAVLMDEFKPERFLAARRAPRRHDDGASSRRCSTASSRSAARRSTATTPARSAASSPAARRCPGPLAHRGDGPLRRHPLQLLRRDRDRPRHARQAGRPARRARHHRPGGPRQRDPPPRRRGARGRAGRGRRALRAEQDARRRLPQATRRRPARA